jgi:hypothetical protein
MIKWVFLFIVIVIIITIIIYIMANQKTSTIGEKDNITSVTISEEIKPTLNLPGEIKPTLNLPGEITPNVAKIDETSNMNHTIPIIDVVSDENDPTSTTIPILTMEEIMSQIPATPTAEEIIARIPAAPTAEEIIARIPAAPTAEEIIARIPAAPTAEEIIAKIPPVPTMDEILAQIPPVPTMDEILAQIPPVPTIDKIIAEIPPYPSITDNLKAAYPVGSIFLTTSSSNPSSLLGFGTWSRIDSDKYLRTSTSGGSTGGSFYITESQLPSITVYNQNTNSCIAKGDGKSNRPVPCSMTSKTIGNGSPYNPPYYTVAAWRRTA